MPMVINRDVFLDRIRDGIIPVPKGWEKDAKRRMQIIPWRELKSGAPGYTLVMEWVHLPTGLVGRDMRYPMDASEFEGLRASVMEAANGS